MSSAPNPDVALPPGPPITALLLDAMGTLLRLRPPVPLLSAALASSGFPNSEEVISAALRTEITYYRRQHLRGGDPIGLAGLRSDCADIFGDMLTDPPPRAVLMRLLVDCLTFEVFEDAWTLLRACRHRGIATAVVSDWDCALPDHLAVLGLADLVDVVVVSSEIGVAKPDARIFRAALDRIGVAPESALHCGDDPVRDLDGAARAGVRGVLLDRSASYPGVIPRITSLDQLVSLV
jgi:FMN phosphatase YigB (HAD superfamily)